MKKADTKQSYSMSYFIKQIIYAAADQNIETGNWEDKTKYLSKVIRKTILPSLDLAEFIKDYEGNKKNPYNREWEEFFQSLVKYDWLNGTTKEENPARGDIRSQNHTIDNSFSTYKLEIFSNLLFAIARGKNPEEYLKKLESTKLYKQGNMFTNWLYRTVEQNTALEIFNKLKNAVMNCGCFFDKCYKNLEIVSIMNTLFDNYVYNARENKKQFKNPMMPTNHRLVANN